jgi:pyruvate/2-oxoglutarate/acetoin dehydrogenase E1 component
LPEIVGEKLGKFHLSSSSGYFPTTTLSLDASNVDVDIVAYGGMVNMAMEAAERLFVAHEILAAIVVPSQLAPLPVDDLSAAVRQARSVVVLEEGNERAGFGAEVIAALATRGDLNGKAARRCAAADTLIPSAASLEREVLPSVERLVTTALRSLQ